MNPERISRNQENDSAKLNQRNKNEESLQSIFSLIKKTAMANKPKIERQSSIK